MSYDLELLMSLRGRRIVDLPGAKLCQLKSNCQNPILRGLRIIAAILLVPRSRPDADPMSVTIMRTQKHLC